MSELEKHKKTILVAVIGFIVRCLALGLISLGAVVAIFSFLFGIVWTAVFTMPFNVGAILGRELFEAIVKPALDLRSPKK